MNKLFLFCLVALFALTIQQEQTKKEDVKKCLRFAASLDHVLGSEITEAKPFLVEMKRERMTDEYRNKAIEKIKEIYGWDFSQKVEGAELVGQAINPEFRHILAGGYAKQFKEPIVFPSDNVFVHEDFWRVKVTNEQGIDIPNMQGKKLLPNQMVGYGEFTYLDKDDKEVLPKTIFWNTLPIQETDTNMLPLVFHLKNEELGDGLLIGAQGLIERDGKMYIVSRAISSFPATLEDLQNEEGMITCKDILLQKKGEVTQDKTVNQEKPEEKTKPIENEKKNDKGKLVKEKLDDKDKKKDEMKH